MNNGLRQSVDGAVFRQLRNGCKTERSRKMQWYFRIDIKFKISQRNPVRKKQTAPENDLLLHWFCSESFVSLSFKLNDHEVLKFSSCAGLPAWSDIKHVYLSSLAFHLLILMLIALFWCTTSNWLLWAFFNISFFLSYLNLVLLNWIQQYACFCTYSFV